MCHSQHLDSNTEKNTSVTLPCFAVRVKPRHEKAVTECLRHKGYPVFLPLYSSTHRSGGRTQRVDLPLFPGYTFSRFDPTNRLPILTTPGVFSILSDGKTLLPIPEHELSAIQRSLESGLVVHPWPELRVGDRVYIVEGPIRGVEGTLQSVKGRDCLIVSVTLLCRSLAIEIDRAWTKPCKSQTAKVQG